jgi:hypothetical protein
MPSKANFWNCILCTLVEFNYGLRSSSIRTAPMSAFEMKERPTMQFDSKDRLWVANGTRKIWDLCIDTRKIGEFKNQHLLFQSSDNQCFNYFACSCSRQIVCSLHDYVIPYITEVSAVVGVESGSSSS